MISQQSQRRAVNIKMKNLRKRNQLWPNIDENKLWVRTSKKGFTTIPRPMPIILRIMDNLSVGKPISSTYFLLWCRVFDEGMVNISNPREIAFEAGFSGQRGETTWMSRMKILISYGFIDAREGAAGPYSYVLIWNPYIIIKELYAQDKVQKSDYAALYSRAQDIGATDLDDIID